MDFMKGEGKAILFCRRTGGEVRLVSYPDESWGIVRDGRTICTWECDELVDCLRTFIALAGVNPDCPLQRDTLATDDALPAWHAATVN
jgi:hypothetical protein